MGASLTFVTVILNVSETVAVPSLAVTLTAMVPTSEFFGVPKKLRVSLSNIIHAGREEPLESVAAYVRLSPLSTSAKVLDGT